MDSNNYNDFWSRHAWLGVPFQQFIAARAKSLVEFALRQKRAPFNLDQVAEDVAKNP